MEQAKKATQKSPNQNPKEIEPKRLVSNVEPMTHKSIIIGFMYVNGISTTMCQVIDAPQNLDLSQPLSKIRKDVIMAFAVVIECKFILL